MQPVAERTPPQESRVPIIGEKTPDVVPAIAELSFRSSERIKSSTPTRGTAPVLSARKVQPAITDFMKSRKRSINGATKSLTEPPEKLSRNAGQIRS
ncbi:hypothetical protein TSAR_005287 [Trichomalopsis sarcophagae]|uniref:Uncharacterized protein n=1 Tax=Trichomalopsis sarcophagae TaxID=543379 RepID=A0A232F436_9HYME|nr:hypothetical protein TSAR_005287 [Trichomalopsis sarcophagae]